MKKYLLIILAVSTFTFVSCSDEDNLGNDKEEQVLDDAAKAEISKAHQLAEDAAVVALMATANKVKKALVAMKAKDAAEKAYAAAQAAGANYKKLAAAGNPAAVVAGGKALAAKAEAERLVAIAKLAGATLKEATEKAKQAKAASASLYQAYKVIYNNAHGIKN